LKIGYNESMKKIAVLLLLCLMPIVSHAQTVDIVWQGTGYSLPFYKGRTVWTKQTQINFLAVPQGLGDPATLDYIWSKNNTVLGNISGIGKNTLSMADTLFSKPVTIKVEIVRGEEELLADSSITLTPASPFVAIYENNPLYGLSLHDAVLNDYSMEGQEVTLTAFPMFFSANRATDQSITYKWGSREGGNSTTYRAPGGTAGLSKSSVTITHKDNFMQSAFQSFLIQFGGNEN
jgi:hypothetical protein